MNLKEKYVHLYTTITSGEMLTDRHIDAASQLLSGQLPDFQGLSTPVIGQTLSFPVDNFLLLQLVFLTYKYALCLRA